MAAIVLGLPQLLVYVAKIKGHTRFTRIEGVWVGQQEAGPHTLWLEALGLFVPLNVYALWRGGMGSAQRHFQLGLFSVFCLSNVVVFQPWEVRTGDC